MGRQLDARLNHSLIHFGGGDSFPSPRNTHTMKTQMFANQRIHNIAMFNGVKCKLISKAQKVGDCYGSFVYRNLYEPVEVKESAFMERISVALTDSLPSERSRHLIDRDAIKKHSVQGTGIFFDGIEQTGFELYLTSHT
jgi:hypothetical protein